MIIKMKNPKNNEAKGQINVCCSYWRSVISTWPRMKKAAAFTEIKKSNIYKNSDNLDRYQTGTAQFFFKQRDQLVL